MKRQLTECHQRWTEKHIRPSGTRRPAKMIIMPATGTRQVLSSCGRRHGRTDGPEPKVLVCQLKRTPYGRGKIVFRLPAVPLYRPRGASCKAQLGGGGAAAGGPAVRFPPMDSIRRWIISWRGQTNAAHCLGPLSYFGVQIFLGFRDINQFGILVAQDLTVVKSAGTNQKSRSRDQWAGS
jgi:hypothetical protein